MSQLCTRRCCGFSYCMCEIPLSLSVSSSPPFLPLSLPLTVGPLPEQQVPSREDGGRDSEPHVGGRPALHGPHDLLPPHLVCPTPNSALPPLPLLHHGLRHLCRVCAHDHHDPVQRRHSCQEQEIPGMERSMRQLYHTSILCVFQTVYVCMYVSIGEADGS